MKLYVYCVAEQLKNFESSVRGIGEQEVELLTIEGLVIPASNFESEAVPLTRENVLRHESVVRKVFAETTPLPFRFGTLITKEALESFISSRLRPLTDRLRAVENSVEMSVKIIWPNLSEHEQPNLTSESVKSGVGPGAAYLKSRREELLGKQELAGEGQAIADWVGNRLNGLSRQHQVSVEPAQKLVLSGSYLVDRELESDFRAELSAMRAERPNLHFLLSGPWPPYTFANIDLEFESHFGVS